MLPLHLSFSSLSPVGLLGEQLSHRLLPSLHPLSALAPPSRIFLLFSLTEPSPQRVTTRFTFNSLQSLGWESVCVSIFFPHLAERMCARWWGFYTGSEHLLYLAVLLVRAVAWMAAAHSLIEFPSGVEIYAWKMSVAVNHPSKDTHTDTVYVPLKCLSFDKFIWKALLLPWLCQKA